jgi:Uma2 family endonuclease
MSALPQSKLLLTADEFFEMEGFGHPGKVELVDGQLRMQHYPSGGHGTIQANLARLIGNHLLAKRPGCRVITEGGVMTTFDPKRNVRRPDVTVTCAPHTKGERAVPQPVLVAQVLSPHNQDEQWESIRACATVGSIIEILVVDSETIDMQVFRRDAGGGWPMEPDRATAGGTTRIASLELELAVKDVYWGTSVA